MRNPMKNAWILLSVVALAAAARLAGAGDDDEFTATGSVKPTVWEPIVRRMNVYAWMGPTPITSGSTPATANILKRARTFSPCARA